MKFCLILISSVTVVLLSDCWWNATTWSTSGWISALATSSTKTTIATTEGWLTTEKEKKSLVFAADGRVFCNRAVYFIFTLSSLHSCTTKSFATKHNRWPIDFSIYSLYLNNEHKCDLPSESTTWWSRWITTGTSAAAARWTRRIASGASERWLSE